MAQRTQHLTLPGHRVSQKEWLCSQSGPHHPRARCTTWHLPHNRMFFLVKEGNETVSDTHSQNSQSPNSALSEQVSQVGCKAVLTIRVSPRGDQRAGE